LFLVRVQATEWLHRFFDPIHSVTKKGSDVTMEGAASSAPGFILVSLPKSATGGDEAPPSRERQSRSRDG